MEVENKQTLSYGLYQELVKALQYEKRLFFTIGKILKTIREEKLYKYIGEGGYETFAQFVSAQEINLTQPRAYFYIRVYEFYIEKMQITEAELSDISAYKLFRLLPLLRSKDKSEVIKVINEVGQLGVADTERVIADKKLENKPDRPVAYPCAKCGKWIIKYREEDICQCDNEFHLINLSQKK